MVVINKTGSAIPAKLGLSGFTTSAKAKVYRYSAAHAQEIVKRTSLALSHGHLEATYPARSITLLVLPQR